ncbi:hypothetical protein P8C59_008701 [Phyllachora maydis]|uniref:Natural resistance-associated macrophage protein n=1 Tax=Phyllachora maydis TaxID=1825666 RepID=A0AAD9IBZ0_9PEZI|nr:hypothetical protein P8C59_008701 [Phyllachora maydis]
MDRPSRFHHEQGPQWGRQCKSSEESGRHRATDPDQTSLLVRRKKPLQRFCILVRDAIITFAKFIGPGMMIAVAYIDPGNYATDVAAGASYQYRLLFVVLLSNCFAIFLQSLSIKLGTVSGLNLAEACRAFLPPWINYLLYFMAEAAIIATDIAEVIGTAIAPSLSAIRHCLKYSITELAIALFTFALFVNSAILIVAGASLYADPDAADADIFGIHDLLSSSISPAAGFVFAVALLLSGISAGIVCTIAGQMVSEGALNWKLKPWLRRLVTRSISITPSIIIAGAVGRSGLDAALNGSQVALSVVLPFVTAPLIYFTARNKYMTVQPGMARYDVQQRRKAAIGATDVEAREGAEGDAVWRRTLKVVSNWVKGNGNAIGEDGDPVKMANAWYVTCFGVLVWIVITAMNIANLTRYDKAFSIYLHTRSLSHLGIIDKDSALSVCTTLIRKESRRLHPRLIFFSIITIIIIIGHQTPTKARGAAVVAAVAVVAAATAAVATVADTAAVATARGIVADAVTARGIEADAVTARGIEADAATARHTEVDVAAPAVAGVEATRAQTVLV